MKTHQDGHQLQLLKGSQVFFAALVQAIDASLHEVRLETYIFNVQGGGALVAQALAGAAARGVAVYVVVDGIGTPELPVPWPARFAEVGVQWRVFKPLGRFGLLVPSRWRRLHRKLCVVDGQVAFCGGMNVLDDWFDPNHGELAAPRYDFSVCVTGPLVQAAHLAMSQFWWRMQAAQRAQRVDWAGAWQALQRAVQLKRKSVPVEVAMGGVSAELVLRDNLRFRSSIERAYRQALGDARRDIIVANAYFFPGRKIRQSLIHAARRGVRVRLLLQGRYEYFMQFHAANALYAPLLAAGVEIYEYTPSFMHAKVAVVDGRWATVGSSNLDPLSLLLAREANVVVQDEVFAQGLQQSLEQAICLDAKRVDVHQHAKRNMRQRVFDALAYWLVRLLLFVTGRRY